MSKVIRLTESDLNKLVKRIVSEQIDKPTWVGGTENKRGPGPAGGGTRKVARTVTLDGSLFKNGIDKIDTGSQAFSTGVNAIKAAADANKGLTVTVIGGASAVGSKEGYNNEDLAKRRSQNFINAVKGNVPGVNFITKTKVGVATVKNSPEANAEQFVKLVFTAQADVPYISQAIDHTAVQLQIAADKLKKQPTPPPNPRKIRVCYELPEFLYATMSGIWKQYEVK
jgi:hypothetical protein